MTADYLASRAFEAHREKVLGVVAGIPRLESPLGWAKGNDIAIGGLEYVAFSQDSRYLLAVSSSGRSVIDVCTQELVARDNTRDGDWLDEHSLQCSGIGPIADEVLRIVGIGGGGLPTGTSRGDSVYLAAPRYPCYEVVFQPNYLHCLVDGHSADCAVIYSGFVKHCGFSWDGNTLIVIDEDIHLWLQEA